ncbi:MAG: thioredoxin [Chloroflexota bacterium]
MTTDDRSSTATGSRPISSIKCPNCGAVNRIGPSERGAPHCGSCGKPLPWVVDADERTFEVETKASPTTVVDLWAPWCGPCRIVSPMLDAFAREHAGRVKIVKVNVDDNQRLAVRFDAMSIPTMVVMRDGQVVDRIVGAMPQPQLWARLEPHLKPPKTAEAASA